MSFSVKRSLLLSLLILMVLSLVFSLPVLGEGHQVRIQAPPVPASLPLLWMEETDQLGEMVDLEIKLSSDHQRAISLISSDDLDMMVTGVNVGAKVYNKGVNVKLLNVNTWAIDYLLTNGEKIDRWSELKGKSLSLPLRGGPLDFLTRYLLEGNGVDPDEVDLVYRPLPNGSRYFMSGRVDAIVLPEPLVTVNLTKNEQAHLSFDIQQEWGKFHDGEDRIPFVGMFVNNNFAEENPEFTSIINGMYRKGVDWVNDNPEQAAELAAENFDMSPQIIRQALERVNLNTYSRAETAELIDIYFKEILEMYPEMLGGKMPDEDFYY